MTTIALDNQQSKTKTVGYGTPDAATALGPIELPVRATGAHDVMIQIEYCGVCHSDIHQARDEWQNTVWPCVPGHEIVGRIAEIGEHVTRFATGERVGVGCMVDSCRQCEACRRGEEQYCAGPRGFTATYNGPFKADGTNTFGGYSARIVVNEDFVLRIPATMAPQAAAPLLCSGVTTFSPLKHFKIGNGDTIGVVGIGGLGHVAIQIAKALGATVIAFKRTPAKAPDAKRFGATDVVVSTDAAAMQAYAGKLDFILSTVPTSHDINPYLTLLKRDGRLTLVGALEALEPGFNNGPVAFQRLSLGGSLIGSIEETQEILDFCAANDIVSTVEVIPIDRINEAFDQVIEGSVRYRYVLDVAGSLAPKF